VASRRLPGTRLSGDLAFRWRWAPDCRWIDDSGWRSASAALDGTYDPWFSVGLTRAGELVGAFHRESRDNFQMTVWAEGACPTPRRG